MGSRGNVALALVAISAALAACGDGDEKRYGDAQIVDKLNLEEVEVQGKKELTIHSDPFCIVNELLNTRSEVEDAAEADKENEVVLTSREGNVGVAGAIVAPDCVDAARKKLSKLDPEPKD